MQDIVSSKISTGVIHISAAVVLFYVVKLMALIVLLIRNVDVAHQDTEPVGVNDLYSIITMHKLEQLCFGY